MSWFSELAGKAECLLNNIDEKTGAVIRNHSSLNDKKNDVQNKCSTRAQYKKISPTRNTKKTFSKVETKSNVASCNKTGPLRNHITRVQSVETQANTACSRKPSPVRTTQIGYNKNRPIMETAKSNGITDKFGLRKRRNSLPADIEILKNQELVYNMQNLEVENEMLKNEINVMNREVSELLERLQKTEDELETTKAQLNNSEKVNSFIKTINGSLEYQLEELKQQLSQKSFMDTARQKEHSHVLETEVNLLNDRNKHMEDRLKLLDEEISSKDNRIGKIEKDFRQAQKKIIDSQINIDKTNLEREQLTKDFDAYKLRVKNMLFAKDNEIKLLREGSNLTEDSKLLMEEIEFLKEEKEQLSTSLSRMEEESRNAQKQIAQLEEMHGGADRLAAALRDALKEERGARNKAEAQSVALKKDLQSLEFKLGQTIANLRLTLSTKEEEINRLREASSTVASADPSALNVAVYDAAHNTDRIQCLTQTLVQKQGKIDGLLAENNILRIQLAKLESKYKAECSSRANHSVVHLHDSDGRLRARLATSPLATLSVKIGVMIKRFPIFRTFIIFYMVGLHLWVLTVLFTSTPDDLVPKPTRL